MGLFSQNKEKLKAEKQKAAKEFAEKMREAQTRLKDKLEQLHTSLITIYRKKIADDYNLPPDIVQEDLLPNNNPRVELDEISQYKDDPRYRSIYTTGILINWLKSP